MFLEDLMDNGNIANKTMEIAIIAHDGKKAAWFSF
jgi:hypothetical protein